jgi:hypothetical protein
MQHHDMAGAVQDNDSIGQLFFTASASAAAIASLAASSPIGGP